ncbi:MAG: hypothetical protein ACYDAB_06125 [bacterium]
MICIDSDIFLIDLRYKTDRRAAQTRAFLEDVRASGHGATTIFNLLEVAGVLSFNLNPHQLLEFCALLPARYGIDVLPSPDLRGTLPGLPVGEVLEVIRHQAAFGDALIAVLVNRLREQVTSFVTWNERHFQGRVSVPVFTPVNFPGS